VENQRRRRHHPTWEWARGEATDGSDIVSEKTAPGLGGPKANEKRMPLPVTSKATTEFDGDRYAYDIDVEAVQAIPAYTEDIRVRRFTETVESRRMTSKPSRTSSWTKGPPMSNGSDPTAVLAALDRAQDAFEMVGRGRAALGGISADEDWKTQLTKACRLLEVVDTLQSQDGYYTAVIEVCFGAIERSIEAYALAMTNDTLQDFRTTSSAFSCVPTRLGYLSARPQRR